MSGLQERAKAASQQAAVQETKNAEARRREAKKELVPVAAERLSKAVGRKVAQRAINVTGYGTDSRGVSIIFTYDEVEFEYGRDHGLWVRRPCPDCGAVIRDSVYSLAGLGRFLSRTRFDSYMHTCFTQAIKGLQHEAEGHARALKDATAFDLLSRAATDYIGDR